MCIRDSPKIARQIWRAAKKLKDDREALGDGDEEDHASKFFEDVDTMMTFGERDSFDGGLDGFLGPPNPNLGATVEWEHCMEEDSLKEFVVPNYLTETTSQVEYWFVADPSDAKLAELQIHAWPEEQRFPQQTAASSTATISAAALAADDDKPVSYTHLTLPTILLV